MRVSELSFASGSTLFLQPIKMQIAFRDFLLPKRGESIGCLKMRCEQAEEDKE